MIGAGSVVTKNVAPFALVYGNPARPRGWGSKSGLTLQFHNGEAACPGVGERYLLKDNRVELA